MNSKIKKFKRYSNDLRKLILDVYLKRDGHLSTSFSCIEILVSLHFGDFVKISKKNYKNKNRNIFILSKGHAELAYYSLMYKLGILNKWCKELNISKDFIDQVEKNGTLLIE